MYKTKPSIAKKQTYNKGNKKYCIIGQLLDKVLNRQKNNINMPKIAIFFIN